MITKAEMLTCAEDCLRHLTYLVSSDDFKLAALYIELFVAKRCHEEVRKTIEERHQATLKIINDFLPASGS